MVSQLKNKAWVPSPNLRACLVGSGSEGMQMPEVCNTVIKLTGKEAKDVNVLYLGTATYDLPGPLYNQTFQLEKAGCTVSSLKVTS